MPLIDLILNLAGVLLWINWRSGKLTTPPLSSPVSLISTLKQAEPRRGTRWVSLISVGLLIGFRCLVYSNIGSTLNWTPSLELGAVSLPFRSDQLPRVLAYCCLSFALVLGGFYAWLLLISVINRKVPNDEPLQRLLRFHLGPIQGWPVWAKLFLPVAIMLTLWALAHGSLVQAGMVPPPASSAHVWEQALIVGMSSWLVWKYLLLILCFLFLLNSYVYLGKSYFWHCVNLTGANLLSPVRRFPLCVGKVDFSPVFGMILIAVVGHWTSRLLPRLFQRLPL